jgi:hypothetical protein
VIQRLGELRSVDRIFALVNQFAPQPGAAAVIHIQQPNGGTAGGRQSDDLGTADGKVVVPSLLPWME